MEILNEDRKLLIFNFCSLITIFGDDREKLSLDHTVGPSHLVKNIQVSEWVCLRQAESAGCKLTQKNRGAFNKYMWNEHEF